MIELLHQCCTVVSLAADGNFHKIAVLGKRNASVEQKVAVACSKQRAVAVQEVDVLLQLSRIYYGCLQRNHYLLLFRSEPIWILRVNRRKVDILNRICLSIAINRTIFKVYLVKQQPVVKLVLRMRHDGLTLNLELDDSYHLVHLGCELLRNRVKSVLLKHMRHETRTRIISVNLLRTRC